MIIPCPPKSLPEWKKLAAEVGGDARAHLAFFRAGNRMPTAIEARALLAIGSKVRFSDRGTAFQSVTDPHLISRDINSERRVEEDVAAWNAHHDLLMDAYHTFEDEGLNTSKLTFQQFVDSGNFLKVEAKPKSLIEQRNKDMVATDPKANPVDPNFAIDQLTSDAVKMAASNKALRYGWSLREQMSKRRQEAEHDVESLTGKLERGAETMDTLRQKYTDADFVEAQAKQGVKQVIEEFRKDLNDVSGTLVRRGVLSQVLRQLNTDINTPLKADRQYRQVMNDLYQHIAGDEGGKFFDLLQEAANMDIDWANDHTKDIAGEISGLIKLEGQKIDPGMADVDREAMTAAVIAFGKTNSEIMDLLQVRKSKAVEERGQIEELLKEATKGTTESISRAKAIARKLPKLSRVAERLVNKYESAHDKRLAMVDELHRAETFNKFHDAVTPVVRGHMERLEKQIGAQSLDWEANDGAEYWVAPKPDANADEVMAAKKQFSLKAGGSRTEDLIRDIQANRAWLDKVPEDQRGAVWNTVRTMTNKLESVSANTEHVGIRQTVTNKAFGSMVDKLESLGLPVTRSAAQRVRRAVSEGEAAQADAEVGGTKNEANRERAKRAMGLGRMTNDQFDRMYHDPALDFAEKNSDLAASSKTSREAFEKLLPKLREWFRQNPETRDAVAKPSAWTALENYYRSSFDNMETVNALQKRLGGKIRETLPDGSTILRDPIGSTFFTALRRTSKSAVQMWRDMRDLGWHGTKEMGKPMDAARSTADYEADPESLRGQLKAFVTPDIWREFVQPLAEREGSSVFYEAMGSDGINKLADRSAVKSAIDGADGDVVRFAENLYEATQQPESPQSKAEFIGQTLGAFQGFYDSLHGAHADMDSSIRYGMPTPPRLLQDARVSEQWPGRWLDYQTYGRHEMHQMKDMLANQAAYGRDLEGMRTDLQAGIREMSAKANLLDTIREKVQEQNPGASRATLEAKIKAEVQRRGENWVGIQQARSNLQTIRSQESQFNGLVASQVGLPMEARAAYEVIGAMAGATVQGPGTAIMVFGHTLLQPFAKFGLGTEAVRNLVGSLKMTSAEAWGSLAQTFHWQIGNNADNARRVRAGIYAPSARRKFVDLMLSRMSTLPQSPVGATIAQRAATAATRGADIVARSVKALTDSGFGKAKEGAENVYAPLMPQAPFSQTMQWLHFGLIDSWTHSFEGLVNRAVEHFGGNEGDRANPAFKFETPESLGYTKRFFGILDDSRAFHYINESLNRRGMNLEQLARDVLDRRKTDSNASVFTDDNFRKIASLVNEEVILHSNLATRPTWLLKDPILKIGNPLFGWGLAKSHDTMEQFRSPDGQRSWKAFLTSAKTYLAIVPMSLAIAWFRDEYDKKVLGKKALREPADSFAGMVDSLSRVGWFGEYGNALNSIYNRDTQKPFSIDNRVFFVSSLLNAKRAMQNWYEQGSADYATVYRPLISSLGGSGYLQYAEILNNAMSLDNAEARVTARINVQNYLRIAGRERGMDVRVSGGGETISNPVRPAIGRMVLAAYANNPADFEVARREAIAAATLIGVDDPIDYIKRHFGSSNPLRNVFKTSPTESEYKALLGILPEDGAQAVSEAVNNFNAFSERIGVRGFDGKKEKAQAVQLPPRPSLPTFGTDRLRMNFRERAADAVFAR